MKIASDRWILMIETSQREGSVALGTVDGKKVDEETFSGSLVHLRELMPTIDALVSRNCSREDLAVIAVSVGPGSFTGIRIGVSAAKALAWALKIPALAISSLEIIAANIEEEGRWGVLLDASSGDLDVACFDVGEECLVAVGEEEASHRDRLPALLEKGTRFIGSGCRDLPADQELVTGPIEWDHPHARRGLVQAIGKVQQILSGQEPPPGWESPHSLQPRYMRISRAEEVRRRRLAGEESA